MLYKFQVCRERLPQTQMIIKYIKPRPSHQYSKKFRLKWFSSTVKETKNEKHDDPCYWSFGQKLGFFCFFNHKNGKLYYICIMKWLFSNIVAVEFSPHPTHEILCRNQIHKTKSELQWLRVYGRMQDPPFNASRPSPWRWCIRHFLGTIWNPLL